MEAEGASRKGSSVSNQVNRLLTILRGINEALANTDEHHAEYPHLRDAKREILSALEKVKAYEAGKFQRLSLGLDA